MEEKYEETPNPLNPDSGPDMLGAETSESVGRDAPEPGEKPKRPIKVVDVSEEESEDEGFKPPVELIGEEEVIEEKEEVKPEHHEDEMEDAKDTSVEPTSEESAYQPPQEVEDEEKSFDIPKGPVTPKPVAESDDFTSLQDTDRTVPVIDMVKPARPTELVEEDLMMEEDYTAEPTDQAEMMAGMGAGMVSSQMNLDPTNRPMEKATTAAQPPKRHHKKTGLIIGMIVSLFIAVGCAVAAVLIFVNSGKEDPVAVAMSRVMNGEAPKNVSLSGTVNIEIDDQTSPISNLEIDLKSEMIATSLANTTSATLTASSRDSGDSATFDLEEIYTANGDLYFKIGEMGNLVNDGETTYLEDSVTTSEANIDGTEVTTDETMPLLATFGMLNMIEGEWIHISLDDLNTLSGANTSEDSPNCLASLASGIKSNGNMIANIYNKYPFVASTDQKVTIASAGNPVYRIAMDVDNFTNFVYEVENSSALSDWTSCVDEKDANAVAEMLVEGVKNLPELYAEVNENYDFTRLYLTTEIWGEENCCPEGAECLRACDQEVKGNMTMDLNFAYPSSVDVSEPTEYKNLSDVVQELFSEMFVVETTEEDGNANTESGGPQD